MMSDESFAAGSINLKSWHTNGVFRPSKMSEELNYLDVCLQRLHHTSLLDPFCLDGDEILVKSGYNILDS